MKSNPHLLHVTALLAVAMTAGTCGEALLGAPKFLPSPEDPVGWRGDGTGRYPGATPPTSWERTHHEKTYSTKGILWMTPLPGTGVSSPIVVGDRIFLTTEVADVVCIDKRTGAIAWIRSNAEFEALSADERKANPAFAEKLDPLLAQLTPANTAVVAELNARLASAPTTELPARSAALLHKREIEKKISDEQLLIDKKGFTRYWGQGVFGFSGPTPASDGKHVCAFFTTGLAACYDLDGKRMWIARGSGGGSEHGNFASPVVCSNRLIVWAQELRAYDVDTGKLAWSNVAKANNTYGSCFRLRCGNDWVAGFQSGFFARVSDGKSIWGANIFGDSVTTPIVENNFLFAWVGYPRNAEKLGFKAYKIPATVDVPKLAPAYTFDMEWGATELAVDKDKNPFDRGYVASPLFVDGLIYQVTQGGGLTVNDAATGAQVYRKILPVKPRTHYWDWAGMSASPTLAGKYIYLMDNQGTTVVIQPGREYKEVAKNVLEEMPDGKSQAQDLATPVFDGSRMYYRTPGYLYCIGEK